MAYNESRLSTFSSGSGGFPRSGPSHPTQVSTQTLLNALHTSYSSNKPFSLESSTSLVINTWLTAASDAFDGRPGGVVDPELGQRAWEHARRRAEDGCIVLSSLHESTPPLFAPFISTLPFSTPDIIYTALSVLRPFFNCTTPHNPQTSRLSSLAATFTLNLNGDLTGANVSLSTSGIDTAAGLLNLPSQAGHRAFDVFYYILSSAATPQEREALGLRHPSAYSLLKRSGTYDSPSYLPTADDSAAAEEFRDNLKLIGITGRARRDLVSTLAAILKLGDALGYLIDGEELENVCADAASLLGLDPDVLIHQCNTEERYIFVAGLYESVVDWVVTKANEAIAKDFGREKTRKSSASSSSGLDALTPPSSNDDDSVAITVLEISSSELAKAAALKTVFDDSEGINAEMKQDGVSVTPAGHSVLAEMQNAVSHHEPDLGIMDGHAGRETELANDRREGVLEKVGRETEEGSFVSKLLYPVAGRGIALGHAGRFDLFTVMGSSRVWFQLCLHPTDDSPANIATSAAPWSASSPSRQLRAWRLPEWANRRNKNLDYTADFDLDEFSTRYSRLGCKDGRDGIESFLLQRGWSNGEVALGTERVWIRENAWWEAERMLDMLPPDASAENGQPGGNYQVQHPEAASSFFNSPFGDNATYNESKENLLQRNQSTATFGNQTPMGHRSVAPTVAMSTRNVKPGDYGLGPRGDDTKGGLNFYGEYDPEFGEAKVVKEQPMTKVRRAWITITWALTFWIPSFLLRYVGRMKRPDVRQAWREKIVLCALIALLNGFIVFFIIFFGRILCPNYDKAFDLKELSYHQGGNDFYVSVHGTVYDLSKFWQLDHSGDGAPPVESSQMQILAGLDLDLLFPIPLYVACPGLVTDQQYQLRYNQSTVSTNLQGSVAPPSQHLSGKQAVFRTTDLANDNWFNNTFLPKMQQYYKGQLVYDKSDVKNQGNNNQKPWAIIHDKVYDLTQYFYTQDQFQKQHGSAFLDPKVENLFQQNMGQDISDKWDNYVASNQTGAAQNMYCLDNSFFKGVTDFRDTPRCQAINYILLAFTVVLCAVILTKFLSALQLGGKKRPAAQDKFVICQVPAYTEGEDHLRKGLDSLTALAYDNKRKLICVICDGMIVGGGNDRPTPKIVLDILGVDPKIDPPALPFKSVGSGNEQLNYGKVYSGLYEYEGNVVPYLVVVKVGKESEQNKSKPGNRGKRDSQIMLMSFLNRVHHRAPMSPLELEMFHQINNIIGVDPELYEYLFMVDADTQVREDALNRLVAACAHDAKIAGICGETSLENEERSWTTMIQVYEYYISHHLAKAFESLFASVTCLPGCFCMYRLRTADRGKPLIISEKVINDYSIENVDTLHKKNLLSLGEDRYLTTLMTKHFPFMSYKFVPSAYAQTAAPDEWGVLLSQRRRWINSTIHNLAELVFLKDLCGFCCFSMRFVVFIDLFGTLMLPATFAYIVYLIYRVATSPTNFPVISVVIIGAVYGLQMIIFVIKRQWQHIGWMIIYILAIPIYAFILPVYSFWKQDDFSWGNTRVVIGEKGSKQVVAMEDEGFDPRSIPLQSWDDYATANNLPGRRGYVGGSEKQYAYDDAYEPDDARSMHSSFKPASTVLTGMKSQQAFHMPPQSPATFAQRPGMHQRQSTLSQFTTPYTDHPSPMYNQHASYMMPAGTGTAPGSEYGFPVTQYAQSPYRSQTPGFQSTDNLAQTGYASPGAMSPGPQGAYNRSGRAPTPSMGFGGPSRPASTINLPNFQVDPATQGQPSDAMVVEAIQSCLATVDLDNVTKKQLKALAEQRLQMQLNAERKAFLDRQIDSELANM